MLISTFEPITTSLNPEEFKREIETLKNVRVHINGVNNPKIILIPTETPDLSYEIETSLKLPNVDIYAPNVTNINQEEFLQEMKPLLDIIAVFYHPGYSSKLLLRGKIGNVVVNDMILSLNVLPLNTIESTEMKVYWGGLDTNLDINPPPQDQQ